MDFLMKLAVLVVIAFAITWFFGLRGISWWVTYACVIGIPLIVMPFMYPPQTTPSLVGGRR